MTSPDSSSDGPALSILAEVGIDLRTGIRSIRSQVDELRREMRRRPLVASPMAAGTVSAGGSVTLDLGSPAAGRSWTTRLLAVTDSADSTAAVTGSARWYVGSSGALSPVGLRWIMSALPATSAMDAVTVTGPAERLICVISGATAGQHVLASALVDDYPSGQGDAVVTL